MRTDRTWMERANCRGVDTNLFFQQPGKPIAAPITVCNGCEVVEECLDYALANHISHGVWGGKSERARRGLARRRRPLPVSSILA